MTLALNSINKKVMLGYIAVLVLLTCSALLLFQRAVSITEQNQAFLERQLPKLNASAALESQLSKLQLAAYALYGTTIDSNAFRETQQQLQQAVKAELKQITKLGTDSHAISLGLETLNQDLNALNTTMSASSIDWDLARNQLAQLSQTSTQIESELGRLNSNITNEATQGGQQISNKIDGMRSLILLTLFLCIAITIVAYIASQRSIAYPVKKLAEQISKITHSRDLRLSIDSESSDEIGVTANSVNQLLNAFLQENRKLQSSIHILGEKAQGVENSSTQTDQQAAELSSCVDSLLNNIDTVEQGIDNCALRAKDASNMAQTGANQVAKGAQELGSTTQHLSSLAKEIEHAASLLTELKGAGDSVSTVVKSIDEIAGQTNLLALNAAIEAARAGESGRGFAVVADEVRTLASRTQESTLEISTILDTIVNSIADTVGTMEKNREQANTTVELAAGTVDSLQEIQQTIEALSEENSALANYANITAKQTIDMRSDVDAISASRESLISNSHSSKAISSSLSELAYELKDTVDQFKV
ncbi:methyl-accepting chemotaxis protein [Agaribacterium sp. ZY112]|uniref:methyl-accepting chemotaxis protein n=1 Tax=Agaribacterium sp. ZY112 TaxID=3233574 RepID=UPI0035258248